MSEYVQSIIGVDLTPKVYEQNTDFAYIALYYTRTTTLSKYGIPTGKVDTDYSCIFNIGVDRSTKASVPPTELFIIFHKNGELEHQIRDKLLASGFKLSDYSKRYPRTQSIYFEKSAEQIFDELVQQNDTDAIVSIF